MSDAAIDYGRELLAREKPAMTYLLYFPAMREVAREHGYALAIHGSLNRDFDLVAVPWTPDTSDAETLVDAICADNALVIAVRDQGDKPHGRRCWTLKGVSGVPHGWVDFSVMPRTSTPAPAGGDVAASQPAPSSAQVGSSGGDVAAAVGGEAVAALMEQHRSWCEMYGGFGASSPWSRDVGLLLTALTTERAAHEAAVRAAREEVLAAVAEGLTDEQAAAVREAMATLASRMATAPDDVRRLNKSIGHLAGALATERARAEALGARVAELEANLRAALIEAGHAEDCPVVHGASVDCAPPGSCGSAREDSARLDWLTGREYAYRLYERVLAEIADGADPRATIDRYRAYTERRESVLCDVEDEGGYPCELPAGHEGPHRAIIGASDEQGPIPERVWTAAPAARPSAPEVGP